LFVGVHTAGRRANFNLLNRASAALEHLEACCQELTGQYPLRYASADEDPFLSYYFSLPEESAGNTPEPVNDDQEFATTDELVETDDGAVIVESLTDEFLRTDEYTSPRISPDGGLVAVFRQSGKFRELVVIEPIGEAALRIVGEADRNGARALELLDIYWVDDENLVFTFSVGSLNRMALARVARTAGQPADVEVSLLGDNWYMIDPLPTIPKAALILEWFEGTRTLQAVDVTDPDNAFQGSTNSPFQSKIRDTFDWVTDGSDRTRRRQPDQDPVVPKKRQQQVAQDVGG